MDLRSTRSRSRTPFTGNNIQQDEVTRVTRSGAHRTYESFTEEITLHSSARVNKTRSKFVKNAKVRTSDYSSEDGEYEVTSTHDEQNAKNSYLENTQSNGTTQYPALTVYREAQEYWNRYPKTDYTYSRHSKDRVEIAPGVINMPNMSRKSIHDQCTMEYSHKQTATDSILAENHEDQQAQTARRALFSNNNNRINNNNKVTYFRSSTRSYQEINIFQRVIIFIQSIFISTFGFFQRVTQTQDAWFISVASLLHKLTSRIMIFDTWLLKGQRNIRKVLALCLIPLLFFGGLWLASTLSYAFNPTRLESAYVPQHAEQLLGQASFSGIPPPPQIVEKIIKIQLDSPVHTGFTNHQLKQMAESLKSSLDLDLDTETIIKIILDDPHLKRIDVASPEIIASSFTDEQMGRITGSLKKSLDVKYDVNHVVERVLESPSIQNLIENYNMDDRQENQNVLIDQLQGEIDRLKLGYVRLSHEMKKCCRRSFVHIESYVSGILKNMLGEHIKKSDLTQWLGAMFVAKEDLESHLNNVTQTLKSEYDVLIENNSKLIMDQIALKINAEMERRMKRDANKDITTPVMPEDEYVRKIVKEVLAIYDADKTGLVDYALESGGGQILSTRCTQNYQSSSAVVSIWGIPLWYVKNTPRTVITPGMHPGECWSFQNFPGFLVIQLSIPIYVEAFSYEHVSRSLIPHGNTDSAPKNFSIYGLRTENDKDPSLIGDYYYNKEGEPLQYFAARHSGAYDTIEMRINSNHGNPKYTCLYRFRVHGKPYTEPT